MSFHSFATPAWYVGSTLLCSFFMSHTVRVVRGVQCDYFTSDSRKQFFNKPFQVTPQSDRMGYRLSGQQLVLSEPLEMISEAVSLGTTSPACWESDYFDG
jgi:antagonist of KipI